MTRTTTSNGLARTAIAATLAAALGLSAAPAAQARDPGMTGGGLGSITRCDASGEKQEGGALLGALLGAAAGSNLARNDRGTGTAVGALVGAAAGSWVGCSMQRNDQAREDAARGIHTVHGVRFARGVEPARFERIGERFVAYSNVNLRAAPGKNARKLGLLRAGERFQALASTRGGWVLVGFDGVGVGWVKREFVAPLDRLRYAQAY